MSALALSPLLAYGLVGVTALLIVLLHLLRPRALRRAVSSTVLWEAVLRQRSRYHTPWRWLLSLLLCLLVGLALAFALGRPEGFAPERSRVVVVLDNSPSMATRTRDGKSRWVHGVERARELIESLSVDVMLVDTMGSAPVNGFVRPAQALEALEQFDVANHGPARLPILPESGALDVHVISDGVTDFETPVDAFIHSVFEPAVNVAVTSLQTRPLPADPLRVEAFVQVYNASITPVRVRLSLRGGDGFSLAQDLTMNADELIDATFDISAFDEGVLAAAAMTKNDAFAQDDIAFAMVAPHSVRNVLLVTRGNPRLEDAMRALPGVRLKVITPETWRDNMSADVYLFDRFSPEKLPARGALLFRPQKLPWTLARQINVDDPTVIEWSRDNSLLDGVSWPALRVDNAAVMVDLPDDAEALVTTDEGVLIAAGNSQGRWIIAGFAAEDSNLSLQPGLPIFLGNALRWLGRSDPVVSSGIGAVKVPLADARIVDGSGQVLTSQTLAGATVFDASKPDVYTALAADAKLRVVANVLDPHYAGINMTRFDGSRRAVIRSADYTRIEPWTALVAIALLLLVIEWAVWSRRIAL
ncbi:MAG: BatA domain-containing protein [Betaproteobacteria bacterium]|nr:MAG: BatA domain-containing protein [Betaproteobacteria bacterium]